MLWPLIAGGPVSQLLEPLAPRLHHSRVDLRPLRGIAVGKVFNLDPAKGCLVASQHIPQDVSPAIEVRYMQLVADLGQATKRSGLPRPRVPKQQRSDDGLGSALFIHSWHFSEAPIF